MLNRDRQTRSRLLQLLDGVLFAASLGLAYWLRSSLSSLPKIESFVEHLWLFPIIGLLAPATLAAQRFYNDAGLSGRLAPLFSVIRAALLCAVALVLVLFVLRMQFARSVIVMACSFGGLFVFLRHELVRRQARNPRWRQRVLWIGTSEESERLREALSFTERTALECVTTFDPRTRGAEELAALLHEHSVNAVIVNLSGLDTAALQPLLATCEKEGVAVVVRAGLFARSPYGMSVDWFAGEPVIHYHVHSAPPSHLAIKLACDHVAAALLLLALSPLFAAIAAGIKLTSPGPVLFRQQRAGVNGRPFLMFKFRSMHVGAEQQQARLAALNEMSGPVFKITDDPRVTRFGRFLRKHSLDELPQLLNVVRGEMSLVGPRPLPLDEVRRFSDDAHRRRLSIRPGLTCLWQISGRNDIARFEDWVQLDLAYIDQWSLWLDVKILLGTIPVVFFGKGGR